MWKDVAHVQGDLIIAGDSGQGSGLGSPSALLEYIYSHSHGLDGGGRWQMGDVIRKIVYVS